MAPKPARLYPGAMKPTRARLVQLSVVTAFFALGCVGLTYYAIVNSYWPPLAGSAMFLGATFLSGRNVVRCLRGQDT